MLRDSVRAFKLCVKVPYLPSLQSQVRLQQLQDIKNVCWTATCHHYSPRSGCSNSKTSKTFVGLPDQERAVIALIAHWPAEIAHLTEESAEPGQDGTTAAGLQKLLSIARFFVFLHFLADLLGVLSHLSKQFKSDDVLIGDGPGMISSTRWRYFPGAQWLMDTKRSP